MASFVTPGRTSYISARDAGAFLAWFGRSDITGPVNGASRDALTIYGMCSLMSQVIGVRAVVEEVVDAPNDPDLSVFFWLFRLKRATCFPRLRPAGTGGYTHSVSVGVG